MATLHLIRHGKAWPADSDSSHLHRQGECQSRLLGEHLAARRQRFDTIYCGPMVRQRDTLRLMREAAGGTASQWPEAVILDGLREAPVELIMRTCLAERLPTDPELRALMERVNQAGEDPRAVRDASRGLFEYLMGLWHTDELRRADLETHADFRDRVLASLERITGASPMGHEVAVVTSNGTIGCIVDHVRGAGGGAELQFANTSVTRVAVDGSKLRLLDHNQTEHIVDPELLTWW